MGKTAAIDDQLATLMQGTAYGSGALHDAMRDELRERLIQAEKEGRPLRVYCGFDPRSTDLHIGHTIPMRKLRQFQEYGHDVIFLIGTFTSLIGDPSDKDKLRPQLTPEEVMANAETYADQAFKVLDPDKTQVLYNAEWLAELDFAKLIHLASNFTVQQFLTRENFRQRFDQNEAIFVHEFFYALMQAYDAFHLKADVQVGGTDQLFNIVTAGRKLMSAQGAAPNIGIIMDILPGTDGEVKMSKSLGNHIPLNTDAVDMYGKVMSVPDAAMPLYYRLVTRWDAGEVDQRLAKIESGEVHPRDAKMAVAYEITEIFYGTQEARRAQEEFVRVFQQGDVPDEIDEYKLKPGQTVLDVMEAAGLVESRGAGRRLIDQNAVSLDGEKLGDANAEFPGEGILRVGKRRFVSVRK